MIETQAIYPRIIGLGLKRKEKVIEDYTGCTELILRARQDFQRAVNILLGRYTPLYSR